MSRARCEVVPGPGSVARRRDSLLWASEQTPESVWDTLVACLGLGARATASATVLQALADTLLPELGPDTAFAILVSDGTAGFVLRHGAVELLTDGVPVPEGTLTALVPGASILLGDADTARAAAGQAPAYRHDLDGGAVPGGALRWTAVVRPEALSPAAPGEPPAAAVPLEKSAPPEPAAAQPVEPPLAPLGFGPGAGLGSMTGRPDQSAAPDTGSDPEQTEFHPAPDPETRSEPSAQPETSAQPEMAQPATEFTAGQEGVTDNYRSTVGVLVFEDGATISLHGDVVLGRRPDTHELVAGGQAEPVVIHDPDHVLSSAHAAIRFHGDEVVVVDLDSLNGTHVAGPEAREWTRLTPGAPFRMQDGYRMLLGWTVLTYRR